MAATAPSFRVSVRTGSGWRGRSSNIARDRPVCETRSLCNWSFKRWLEAGRQQMRAAGFHNDHVVFAAKSVIAGNINSGFVGKRHPRLKDDSIPANEVRPLVAIHADAVAQTMREVLV